MAALGQAATDLTQVAWDDGAGVLTAPGCTVVSAICQRTIDLLQPSIAIESSPNTRRKTNSTSDQLRQRCASVPAMSATNVGHPTRRPRHRRLLDCECP